MWAILLIDNKSRTQRALEAKKIGVCYLKEDSVKNKACKLEVYPFIPIQRCWTHKLRNVACYLPYENNGFYP